MNKIFNSLKILRGLEKDGLIKSLLGYTELSSEENYNDFLAEVYAHGAENKVLEYVQNAILHDQNAFSISCAEGSFPSDYLIAAHIDDVNLILNATKKLNGKDRFRLGPSLQLFTGEIDRAFADKLCAFYRENGYGDFIDGKAYEYIDGKLVPITCTTDVNLSQLKDYKSEKAIIENNILDFIGGLNYSHMLLYGDKGTGKSSTIHAMLNKYYKKSLRIIELDKNNLAKIGAIKQLVYKLSLKFIIFIDDLSFTEDDQNTSTLKAAVEGSLYGGSNCMIVATSNRRHIIKESFSNREDSVHASDSIEEQLSLSDRFALTVLFASTDKQSYLSIVNQLAKDLKLKTPASRIEALAERWAIIKGGRSPRRAKQFVDYCKSCECAGRDIEF